VAVAEFMQRMLVGKCTQQKCDMERFNLMILNAHNRSVIWKDSIWWS